MAQQVRDVFLAHGIDGTRFGLLCYDEWDDIFEPVIATKEITDTSGELVTVEYDTGEQRLVKKRVVHGVYGLTSALGLRLHISAVDAIVLKSDSNYWNQNKTKFR